MVRKACNVAVSLVFLVFIFSLFCVQLFADIIQSANIDEDVVHIVDDGVPLANTPSSFVLNNVASGTSVSQNGRAIIDYSNAKDGYVMIAWRGGGNPKLKVLIKGKGPSTYQYNLRTDGQYESYPLSDGNGTYTVGVYKNSAGTEYTTVLTATINVTLNDEFAPFLRPNQYVNFTDSSLAIKKASELCANLTNNLSKVEAIYSFVVNNIKYDSQKASTVQSGYVPDIDTTLDSKKGICLDYAALMSAMLRSQNVPVQLVAGYTGGAYHAWINVYSSETGWIEGKIYFDGKSWKLMDPTFASSSNSSAQIMEYIGNGDNYTTKFLY